VKAPGRPSPGSEADLQGLETAAAWREESKARNRRIVAACLQGVLYYGVPAVSTAVMAKKATVAVTIVKAKPILRSAISSATAALSFPLGNTCGLNVGKDLTFHGGPA